MKNTLFIAPPALQRHGRCKIGAFPHSCRVSRVSSEAGITLMEVLAVIIIVGIMTTIAAPNFANFVANSRISSASNDLVADLMQARSTASTNGHRAIVCPSTTGSSCSTTASDWAQGRIVFICQSTACITSGSYNPTATPADTLIKYASGLPSNLTVTMTTFPNTYIAYNSYGGMFPLGTGTFTLCVKGASQQRQITINSSGRPSIIRIPASSSAFTCP